MVLCTVPPLSLNLRRFGTELIRVRSVEQFTRRRVYEKFWHGKNSIDLSILKKNKSCTVLIDDDAQRLLYIEVVRLWWQDKKYIMHFDITSTTWKKLALDYEQDMLNDRLYVYLIRKLKRKFERLLFPFAVGTYVYLFISSTTARNELCIPYCL